jgi:hypothetical protein
VDEKHGIDRRAGGDPLGVAEFDQADIAGYEEHPIDEPDAWGDLGSFRSTAART